MALLNHPKSFNKDAQKVGSLTLALSALGGFLETFHSHSIRVNAASVDIWAAIGRHTYSFPFYRADTIRIPVSGQKSSIEFLAVAGSLKPPPRRRLRWAFHHQSLYFRGTICG